MVKLEKEKKEQDRLVDAMNEQVKRLNEQKAIYATQLASQREETLSAQQTLKEALNEMERILASKRSLMEEWKNSLKGLQVRNDLLQKFRDWLTQKKNRLQAVDGEIKGVEREITENAIKSENLEFQRTKCENAKQKLDADIEEGRQVINKLQAQLDMLKDSIEQTENEKKKCEIELSDVMLKQQIVEGRMTSVYKETNRLLEM